MEKIAVVFLAFVGIAFGGNLHHAPAQQLIAQPAVAYGAAPAQVVQKHYASAPQTYAQEVPAAAIRNIETVDVKKTITPVITKTTTHQTHSEPALSVGHVQGYTQTAHGPGRIAPVQYNTQYTQYLNPTTAVNGPVTYAGPAQGEAIAVQEGVAVQQVVAQAPQPVAYAQHQHAYAAPVHASYAAPAPIHASYAAPAPIHASYAAPAPVHASYAAPAPIHASYAAPAHGQIAYNSAQFLNAGHHVVQPAFLNAGNAHVASIQSFAPQQAYAAAPVQHFGVQGGYTAAPVQSFGAHAHGYATPAHQITSFDTSSLLNSAGYDAHQSIHGAF